VAATWRRITDLARLRLRRLSNPAILAMTLPPLAPAAGCEGAMVSSLRSTVINARNSLQGDMTGTAAHPHRRRTGGYRYGWRDEHVAPPVTARSSSHIR